ncbi:HAD-IIB family hydrolase [Streptococcus merionis]|uniref:Putative HAD-superfamily hydrolase n=1 Tax=Streptococcus merionis TaxID=400065 RepID=A0A239SQL8_9STRE|nr:HAD-IIB family hydrolase [Streptococcus merionis]SNU87700.1 putative HAD-superfamily hydrolase [Streptococcus merionis]
MKRRILCITDLDGTFVKNSVNVNSDDLQAYHQLCSFSDFSVATGRSVEEIHYIAQKNKIDLTHLIGFNGALVESNGNTIFSQPLTGRDVHRILNYLKEEQLIFDALDGQSRIGNFVHEHTDHLWNMELICLDNPFESLKEKTIYKFNVRPTKEVSGAYFQQLRVTFPHLEIFKAGDTRIEITAKGVSKGHGVELVKTDYDLVIAFGDSGNDISMFQETDISYCISSAPKYVQEKATYVSDSFYKAVQHLIGILIQERDISEFKH